MAKKIILLSDGTGNSAGKVWRTNVWRVFQALELKGSNQIAIYDDGVGTSSFKPLAILGGVFGRDQAVYVAVARDDASGMFIQRIAGGAARWRRYRSNGAG